MHERGGDVVIDVAVPQRSAAGPLSRSDLDGLTFYVPDGRDVGIAINGRELDCAARSNPPDGSGRPSVSIRWPRLEFPSL